MTTYKKHFKVILAILSILILIMLIPAVHILYFTPLYIPGSYTDYDIYIRKDIYSKNLKDKKIIIASGSNANFGINSEILSNKTEYEVLNLGVNAGYPINYLKYRIMKYAKKGDVVILPLEVEHIFRTDNFKDRGLCDRYTTYDKDFFMTLSISEKFRVLMKVLPFYPLRLRYGLKKLPIHTLEEISLMPAMTIVRSIKGGIYDFKHLNQVGERLVDRAPQEPAKRIYVDGYNYNLQENPSDLFISEIKSLEKELKEIGVDLYITFPSTLRNKKFDVSTKETQKLLKKLLSNIEAKDIKFLGNPYFYNLPLEYFFDHRYHLNARGCILRTLCLADDINKMLKEGAKVDFTPPSEEYIAEKLEETDLILEDFHKRQDELDALNKN